MKCNRKGLLVICLICLLATVLSGCIGLVEKIQEQNIISEPAQTVTQNQETAETIGEAARKAEAAAKKAEFEERAELIEVYSVSNYETATTQVELNRESGVVYAKWDALLNDIYQYLKQTMTPADFAVLEADEIAWVQHKEKVIETAAEGWKGGSGEPMARNSAGIVETSERCYYLISLID